MRRGTRIPGSATSELPWIRRRQALHPEIPAQVAQSRPGSPISPPHSHVALPIQRQSPQLPAKRRQIPYFEQRAQRLRPQVPAIPAEP